MTFKAASRFQGSVILPLANHPGVSQAVDQVEVHTGRVNSLNRIDFGIPGSKHRAVTCHFNHSPSLASPADAG